MTKTDTPAFDQWLEIDTSCDGDEIGTSAAPLADRTFTQRRAQIDQLDRLEGRTPQTLPLSLSNKEDRA